MSNSKRINTVTAIAALGAVAITGAAAGVYPAKALSCHADISAAERNVRPQPAGQFFGDH